MVALPLPAGVSALTALRFLTPRVCRALEAGPDSIGGLQSLMCLDLRDRTCPDRVAPTSVGALSALSDLQLDGTRPAPPPSHRWATTDPEVSE